MHSDDDDPAVSPPQELSQQRSTAAKQLEQLGDVNTSDLPRDRWSDWPTYFAKAKEKWCYTRG
jgi:hypothetical protein